MKPQSHIYDAILSATAARGPEKSICPSEVARLLFPGDWRSHMKDVVDAAIDLQMESKVIITQHGEPVDIDDIKGPIRIKAI